MIVVGDSLSSLARNEGLTSDASGIEAFSIRLTLGSRAIQYKESDADLLVTHALDSADYEELDLTRQNLVLKPGHGAIASTAEIVRMPLGFFGLLQTKGTVARFLVQATCCDGQVEPGYRGRVTLEIVNFNRRAVIIPAGTPIAQLFIVKTSPRTDIAYAGRYQDSDGPTLPRLGVSG